jgi:hypothetical protein
VDHDHRAAIQADQDALAALTPEQDRLLEVVQRFAGGTGIDCRDVLIAEPASNTDKAAVAAVLGGPEAAAEFLTANNDTDGM